MSSGQVESTGQDYLDENRAHLQRIGEVVFVMHSGPVRDPVSAELPVEDILVHVQQRVDTSVTCHRK